MGIFFYQQTNPSFIHLLAIIPLAASFRLTVSCFFNVSLPSHWLLSIRHIKCIYFSR